MKARRRLPSACIAWTLALTLAATTAPGNAEPDLAQLSDVTVKSQPGGVTVFVKTSRETKYKVDLIDAPVRLLVDLEDTAYGWRKAPLAVGVGPVKQVRGGQYRPGVSRIVLDMTHQTGFVVREEAGGLAIVIPTSTAPESAGTSSSPVARPVAVPPPPSTPPAPLAAPVQLAQATSQVAAAGGPRLISLDFKDADVVNLLRILAAESGRNIVVGDDVKGKMSITLRNVPWELALDTILETRGLRKMEKDGVLRIVSNEQLLKEREAVARVEEAKLKAEHELRAKAAEAALKEQEAVDKRRASEAALAELRARGPLKEETIRLSYADPEELAKTLQGILGIPPEGVQAQLAPPLYSPTQGPPNPDLRPVPALITSTPPPLPPAPTGSPSAEVLAKGITIRAHKPTNSLFIRHYESDLERIKTLIREKFDIRLPQVKIEARMEILDRRDLLAIGVQWGGGGVVHSNSTATVVGRGFTSAAGNTLTSGGIPIDVTNNTLPPNAFLTLGSPAGQLLPVSATTGLPSGGNIVNIPIGSLLEGAATAGAGGIAFGIVGSRINLNLALEALRAMRKTRTLSRPEIVTVENSKASMSLGEEIPYATVSSAGTQVQFKEALLKLEVTPTVVRDPQGTHIKMNVVVENNQRGATVSLGSSGTPPAIVRRKAETQVLIKEGERLVIGGVTDNTDDEEERKVPLFGDIPFLGWLFKSRGTRFEGSELVVFITPTVLGEFAAQGSKTETPKK